MRGFRNHTRALEVACGSGTLTRDLLSSKYDGVDLFDACSGAVADATENTKALGNIGCIEMCKMEDYVFARKYSAIYVRWCIGYLTRDG